MNEQMRKDAKAIYESAIRACLPDSAVTEALKELIPPKED